jgi:L-histidine Nalpha-methyltransferase
MTAHTTTAGRRWTVHDHPAALTRAERLARDVRTGLGRTPPTIPSRWFYDEKGSVLFDEITRLPEYYPTRRETEILVAHAGEIAAVTGATTLVEFGSGTSTKTRLLLDALTARGRRLQLVPLDVSVEVLTEAARTLADDYPSISVEAVVADFEDPLQPLPGAAGERLVIFLGGTIGNFAPDERADFYDRLRAVMSVGDSFLLGADLVKDTDRLVAAYDDTAGVTAAFNRNVIEVLQRELDADGLSADDFVHVARWNPGERRIEMWLRARRDIDAWFPSLGLRWSLPAGGEVLTEISTKFDVASLRGELAAHGFGPVRTWTDSCGDFSLTLARATGG